MIVDMELPPVGSESTGPQVIAIPNFDSRLAKNGYPHLTWQGVNCLRRDPTIKLVRELAVSAPVATPWTIEATPEAPEGAQEFIAKHLLPHKLLLVQNAFFGTIDYGFAPFECIWQTNDDLEQIIIEYKQLLQEWTWIVIDKNSGRFLGFSNEPIDGRQVLVMFSKALNVTIEVEGTDWYGVSVFEALIETNNNWEDSNSSAKRFDSKMAGAQWIVYYPTGKTRYSKNEGKETDNGVIATDILKSLEASGGTAIPDEIQQWMDATGEEQKGKWRIELISATTNSSVHFTDRLKYLDNLKARAFGFPERSILEGKFGTKAEAETHADAAILNMDRKHRVVTKHVNKGPVNSMLEYNFGPRAKNTVFAQVAPINDSRLALLRDIYSRIMQQGDLALEEMTNLDMQAIREQLGLPNASNTQSDT
jgi:hypothetical protein